MRFEAANLADIHNHLVPGVDDGARTIGESLCYLQALAADGVTRMAVSPHLDGRLVYEASAVHERLARLEAGFAELGAACAGRHDVPALVFSQEVLVPDPETAARLLVEPRVGLAGTPYVLIEFGFELGEDPAGVVSATLGADRRPVVAHPERYRRRGDRIGLEEVRSWKTAGALLQVNIGSVLGDYGEGIAELAWQILGEGLADLLATDHHATSRPVSPARGWRELAARGAAEHAHLLLSENPQRILAGQETMPVGPLRSRAVA